MALINCPECGQEASDRASVCPKCAFPLSELRTDGTVRIKLYPSRETLGVNPHDYRVLGKVPMEITDRNWNVLWSGVRAENATFTVEKPTNILIYLGKRHICSSLVEAGKKYMLCQTSGFFKQTFHLTEVDVIDVG